jgi:hypothetical protein
MSAQRASRISTCMTLLLVAAALALAASAAASSRLTVEIGTNRTYNDAQLRPEETVVCHYQGHTLRVQAPSGGESSNGAVWPLLRSRKVGLFHLNVSVAPKHRFAVRCARGGSWWVSA